MKFFFIINLFFFVFVVQMPLNLVRNGIQSFTWEGVWRSILPASLATSLDVRKDAGHTLKSSLKVCFLFLFY